MVGTLFYILDCMHKRICLSAPMESFKILNLWKGAAVTLRYKASLCQEPRKLVGSMHTAEYGRSLYWTRDEVPFFFTKSGLLAMQVEDSPD